MLLKLAGISKSYSRAAGQPDLVVLSSISLDVQRGASLAITGPSGSGKTTLLNIIGTLDRPTNGSVFLDGEDLTQADEQKLAEIRCRRIGTMFQAHHLLPQCTALENVLVPALAKGTSAEKETVARGLKLLDRVGLSARASHRPGELSGGERQRVAVARALINEPVILLADEPTGALDRQSADALAGLLLELNRERKLTLIVATHAAAIALKMSRRLELQDGRLVQCP